MGYPTVHEQLKLVSNMLQQREDLHKYLELQRKVLQSQLEIDATPNKGVRGDWSAQRTISALEKKALKSKKPLVHFLDFIVFEAAALTATFRKVANILIETYPTERGLRTLTEQIDVKKIDPMKMIEAALREDEASIVEWAKKIEVAPPLLLYVASAPIQPFVEELARCASFSFYERWWQIRCPICGRMPEMARVRNRKRYLMCSFCGAEYLADYFVCVNCGNKDPYSLRYMKIDGKPEFQIDFCTKCKHYIKVIIENALRESIPRCMENILTLELDIEAKYAGLNRHE